MHRCQARAAADALAVGLRVEKTDVLGDRTGEELVVLHHARHGVAIARQAQPRQRHAADFDAARGGLQQAEHQLDERRLAAARWPDDGHRFGRLHAQAHVVDQQRVRVGVAETHVFQLDAGSHFLRADGVSAERGHVVARLGRSQCDVGHPLGVQAEHAHLEPLLDQRRHALHELRLVGDEREQHADREAGAGAGTHVKHQARAEPHGEHVFDAEQRAVEALINQPQALGAQGGVELVDHQVLPGRAALVFAGEQLDALHAAHALQKVAVLARAAHDLLFAGEPEGPVQQQPQHGIERGRRDADPGQPGAVEKHHGQRGGGHHAIDQGFEKAGGQGALDAVQRLEARHHVTDVALVEPHHRQADQVAEQVRQQLQVERAAQHHQHPCAQPCHAGLQQCQQQEADSQHADQIPVLRDQRLVDHPLHVERAEDREHLQHQRQHQHLREAAGQARQLAHQDAQRHTAALVGRREGVCGRELERHAGEVF